MKKLLTIILVAITLQSFAPIKIFKDEEIIKKEIGLSHKEKVIRSIIEVESGSEPVINYKEMAFGKFQVRQVYLSEIYRLTNRRFTLDQMMNDSLAIEAFTIMVNIKCKTWDLDSIACLHNSGQLNEKSFRITKIYRDKVKKEFNKL